MTASDARFVAMYERYYRHIYAYCRRRSNADRVDDAVAETFLITWRRISEVPEDDATLPWLYGVAYRVLGHQIRGLSRRTKLDRKLTAIGIDPVPATDDYLVQRHESRAILEALGRLKPADQEILKLSIWEELPHHDVASVLEISIDAAKQRLSRARRHLAREYDRLENRRSKTPAAQEGGAW